MALGRETDFGLRVVGLFDMAVDPATLAWPYVVQPGDRIIAYRNTNAPHAAWGVLPAGITDKSVMNWAQGGARMHTGENVENPGIILGVLAVFSLRGPDVGAVPGPRSVTTLMQYSESDWRAVAQLSTFINRIIDQNNVVYNTTMEDGGICFRESADQSLGGTANAFLINGVSYGFNTQDGGLCLMSA